MVIHLDVVIDVDLVLTPFSENVAMGWQGFEGGFIQVLKEALRVPWSFSKGRLLRNSTCWAIASLSSAKVKNVRCLRGTMTQRSA